MRLGCSYSIMTEDELDKVLSIEKSVFRHPWSRNFFKHILSDINNYLITLRQDKILIGYGGYHLLKDKKNFLATKKPYSRFIHLINLAIHPSFQNRGYGTFLMNTLMNNARTEGVEYCYLEVRPSNTKAVGFYKKFGFSIIGLIENYYYNDREDALVMGSELKQALT